MFPLECDEGKYGANCRLQCHCAEGVPCLKDTGECKNGQCHPDWYGINCQGEGHSTFSYYVILLPHLLDEVTGDGNFNKHCCLKGGG